MTRIRCRVNRLSGLIELTISSSVLMDDRTIHLFPQEAEDMVGMLEKAIAELRGMEASE